MYQKNNTKSGLKEIDLPTLIDMVFLLLIFFISTLTVTPANEAKKPSPEVHKQSDLPQASGKAVSTDRGPLTTMLLQIQPLDEKDPNSPKVLYILLPNREKPVSALEALESVQLELLNVPPDSSHFAVFPGDFLKLDEADLRAERAFLLIADAIQRYQSENFQQESSSNTIEIRATKDTEFKIINFIMQECSAYEERIPKVTFRVMAPDEAEEGVAVGL